MSTLVRGKGHVVDGLAHRCLSIEGMNILRICSRRMVSVQLVDERHTLRTRRAMRPVGGSSHGVYRGRRSPWIRCLRRLRSLHLGHRNNRSWHAWRRFWGFPYSRRKWWWRRWTWLFKYLLPVTLMALKLCWCKYDLGRISMQRCSRQSNIVASILILGTIDGVAICQ